VALFTNDLRAVPAALMLSRAAGRVILANIAFAIVTKASGARSGARVRTHACTCARAPCANRVHIGALSAVSFRWFRV
jgi:cation transport ATPase